MRINGDQMDRQTLARLGEEAVALLQAGDFGVLAERFGYALACGREPAKAIESDLTSFLSEDEGARGCIAPSMSIKYYDAHTTESTGLVAAIECVAKLADNSAILLALVVTGKGSARHIGLEGISRV